MYDLITIKTKMCPVCIYNIAHVMLPSWSLDLAYTTLVSYVLTNCMNYANYTLPLSIIAGPNLRTIVVGAT